MLSISNHERWTLKLIENSSEEALSIALTDRWDIQAKKPIFLFFEKAQKIFTDRFSTVTAREEKTFLWKKLTKLSKQNNPYAFSIYNHNEASFVVFGRYGLMGGVDLSKYLNKLFEVAQFFTTVSGRLPTSTQSIDYVDVDNWFELVKHVVLIHALPREIYVEGDVDMDKLLSDPAYAAAYAVRTAISPEGCLGGHLNHRDNHYNKKFIDRPHLHWTWNQLVQPHGPNMVNNWENSFIAILEPMSSFEEEGQRSILYSVAPFDTMSIGPHTLSQNATLIIPEDIEDEIRNYLKNFAGKIVTYKFEASQNCLRGIIYKELKKSYPDVWHLVNDKGEPIAEHTVDTGLGYMEKTVVQKEDGRQICLIEQEGVRNEQIKCTALKRAKEMGKGLGLHEYSITNRLEKNFFLQETLRCFIEDPLTLQGKKFFVGYATTLDDLKNLGALVALKYWQDQSKMASTSNALNSGDYILHNALFADFFSLSLFMNTEIGIDHQETFTLHERALMVSVAKNSLVIDLQEMQAVINSETKNIDPELRHHFNNYKAKLSYYLKLMLWTKKFLTEPDPNNNTFICSANKPKLNEQTVKLFEGKVLQKEWAQLEQSGVFEGEFLESWPLKPSEQDYAVAMRSFLPAKHELISEVLKQIEEQIKNAEGLEKKRLLFIKYCTSLHLKEIYFYGLKRDNLTMTPNYPYGMKLVDATRVIGNCLFDNIAYQLVPDSTELELIVRSRRLRECVVNAMRSRENDLSKFFQPGSLSLGTGEERITYHNWEGYLQALSRDTIWADELVIKVMADVLRRPILIVRPDTETIERNCIYNLIGPDHPLLIGHINGNHFATCLPPNGETTHDILYKCIPFHECRAFNTQSELFTEPSFNREQVNRKEILELFLNSDLAADQMVNILSRDCGFNELYSKLAGVSEGYTVAQHTKKVIEIAQKYKNYLEPLILKHIRWEHFLLFLAFHDIGRGLSLESKYINLYPMLSIKELQLLMSRIILRESLEILNFSTNLCNIFQALLMYDSQGNYLKGDIDLKCFKNHIWEMSTISGLTPSDFYTLYNIFHLVDAASYESLSTLFIFGSNFIEHCAPNQERLDILSQLINESNTGTSFSASTRASDDP